MRIVSLKWKALWGLSLVLFTIIAGLSWLSYSNLLDQFENSRVTEEAVQVREIHALLRQIDARLQQLASWLPALEGMSDALREEDPHALEQLFERHWPSALLDYDLLSVSFYSTRGRLIGRWDDGSVPSSVPMEWVARVANDEQPLFAVSCADRCYQVGVLPLLVENRSVGTLVLTASVAELIVRFREVTGRDIGLLVQSLRTGDPAEESTRELLPWGMKVVALSDAPNRLPLLRRVAQDHPALPQLPLKVRDGKRYYSIRLFPLHDFTPYGEGQVVVLSDISDADARIHEGAWRSILAGIGGIVASELVLFLILSTPLTRLQRTAQVLPLLAHNGFDEVRSRLKSHKRRRGLGDETDNLDCTAIDLAFQLEALNNKVQERTEALKLRMLDLDRKQSFVSSLLDTAQVMIVTQDREGRIGLANRYTLEITGFESADLVGRPFRELLNPDDAYKAVDGLERLVRNETSQYSHEAELLCPTGRRLQLAWYHSALGADQEGGAVVLSAGLDITERKHAELRIAWLADHDPLTGLVNRRRFEDRLQRALQMGLNQGKEIGGALMYIDLDEFKLINDTLGHSAGDRVLESFASNLARLGDTIAPAHNTIAARLGGDEFAVIVESVDREGAMIAAESLRTGINGLEYNVGAKVFRITSSIGVALFPEHGLDFQGLMQNADLAMYQAKSLGEGRVQLFTGDEAMRMRFVHRMRWKERIDEALGNDGLRLFYQPILELKSDRVSHYEALVRMLGENDELMPPADFIPVAEATGQITRIDCRVLEMVFTAWQRLRGRGGVSGLHINLSARTFQAPEWWTLLNQLLDSSAVDPSELVFEITETAAMSDLKDAGILMEGVRGKGCCFALDDFGVGFSSFNYVKELPVDLVKIDGTFIAQLAERPDNRLVVKALVEVARGFGKRTVAEFVDSAATLELLKQLNVDYAQGFYVGKPLAEYELFEGYSIAPDTPLSPQG